jgi:hypothetical protein
MSRRLVMEKMSTAEPMSGLDGPEINGQNVTEEKPAAAEHVEYVAADPKKGGKP